MNPQLQYTPTNSANPNATPAGSKVPMGGNTPIQVASHPRRLIRIKPTFGLLTAMTLLALFALLYMALFTAKHGQVFHLFTPIVAVPLL